jgi:hypothetical protein
MREALMAPAISAGHAGEYGWRDIDATTDQIAVGDFARRPMIRLQPRP